ncbi:carboxymuconolactone decarboxylase family protein [Amycolatopsis pithecellobii]|uniref:Carboxymuconolactone decarboxylase-like domain-containing protein n=1 Tax=Amycolatopsis pithecellobii TaxID=664692 RepID=A0A6N7YYS5_9PSEU|nr:carboxymuconolactone decarboxylase family protein [Amycolatopsis pithecellobii]MTD57048.1 hypothetical protein [Amycolatopsis pithecellobii]
MSTEAVLARRDPALLAAYRALTREPAEPALSAVVRSFVRIAAYGTLGGIDETRLHKEIATALELGATEQQIVDVLEIVSISGIHTAAMATPIMLELARELGLPLPGAEAPEAAEVREEFISRRGYWSPLWEAIAAFDPGFLKAYLDYSSIPVERATVDAPTRELIFVVINSVTTHLNPGGVGIHIRNALNLGVTPGQLMEVFRVLAPIGIASCFAGFAALDAATSVPSQ